MLGLRPRLRARNSLWDLVNKHTDHLYPTSQLQPHWQQPVEERLDGLPPLPVSPVTPSHSVTTFKLDEEAPTEQYDFSNMAPVCPTVFILMAARALLSTPTAVSEATIQAVSRRSWRRAVWCV